MSCEGKCVTQERKKIHFSDEEGREIKDISERFSRLGEIYGARVRSSSSPLWYRERFYYSRLYSPTLFSLVTRKP